MDNGDVRLPDFVEEATYLINMALPKSHGLAGVTLCSKNFFGSLWRPSYFRYEGWDPSHMHYGVAAHDFYAGTPLYQDCPERPMGSHNPLVELMGHEELGGKVLIFFMDGMWGEWSPRKWQMDPFNNDWMASLMASMDPVAIDSVALDILRSEAGLVTEGTLDNYLHEEALAHDPCSGSFYDPEDDGTRLASLGVHEHWNNALDRQYSRNLGTGSGIELIYNSTPCGSWGYWPGDLDKNCYVDQDDLAIFAGQYLGTPGEPSADIAPLGGDGNVSLADFAQLSADWMKCTHPLGVGCDDLFAPPPSIELSTSQFAFYGEVGGANPADQILTVRNGGAETLDWQISESCDWLAVDPNSGSSTGEGDEVTMSVNITSLATGVHECELTVSAPGVSNSPQAISVVLLVLDEGVLDQGLIVPAEYATIQEAVDAAEVDDMVIILPGTYTGPGNRDVDFGGKAITVRGKNGPENCIIDCQGTIGEPHRGFSFHSGEDHSTVLQGLTIIGGYGTDVTVPWGTASVGGAILCTNQSGPTIRNCVMTGNVVGDLGGAIFCQNDSSPTLDNCLIVKNTASHGGAMYCYDGSSPEITNCTFSNNSVVTRGGAIRCLEASSPTITNSIFWGNEVTDPCGGPELALRTNCTATVTYSDMEGGAAAVLVEGGSNLNWGIGSISVDPCFVDAAAGDYHLQSQAGRWDPNSENWLQDGATSRAIDAGNPGCLLADEPQDANNLRINLGAYGGTSQASKTPTGWALLADMNNDGKIDLQDHAAQATMWLITAGEQPGDLDRNGTIDIIDLCLLGADWLKETTWCEY